MKMLKVDNFLGCMTLETGGLVIGWFNAIGNVLAIIGGIVIIIVLCVYDCDDLTESGSYTNQSFFCSYSQGLIILFGLLLIIFGIGFSIISFLCIRGTHLRRHTYVKPMTVLMGVCTFFVFIRIFSSSVESIGPTLGKIVIYGYQFIVMHSLYSKFQGEYENGLTAQYQATMDNGQTVQYVVPINSQLTDQYRQQYQAPIDKV